MAKIINGVTWYYRLVSSEENKAKALMDYYSITQLEKHLVMCYTPNEYNGKPVRLYAYFDTHIDFYKYMMKFEPNKRSFYEIILGEYKQKPHFDLDIDKTTHDTYFPNDNFEETGILLKNYVIRANIELLKTVGIEVDIESDILIYSSHSNYKNSYHIVINNMCHFGNKEARAYYDEIMILINQYTNNKYSEINFIDKGVYSPRQQFRVLGSQKIGSKRPKIFNETFKYFDEIVKHKYIGDEYDITMKMLCFLGESLCSVTTGCKLITSFVKTKINVFDPSDATEVMVQDALDLMYEKMPDCPFVYSKTKGNIVTLKRTGSSYCPICHPNNEGIPHENEHPFLIINNDDVYWNCRRSKSGNYYLGKIMLDYTDDYELPKLTIDGVDVELLPNKPIIEPILTINKPNIKLKKIEENLHVNFTIKNTQDIRTVSPSITRLFNM